jgi:hypothetical protein
MSVNYSHNYDLAKFVIHASPLNQHPTIAIEQYVAFNHKFGLEDDPLIFKIDNLYIPVEGESSLPNNTLQIPESYSVKLELSTTPIECQVKILKNYEWFEKYVIAPEFSNPISSQDLLN